MNVFVNDQQVKTEAATLAMLIEELGLPDTGTAAGMADTLVPRNAWSTTRLEEGARIVIVKAACGG